MAFNILALAGFGALAIAVPLAGRDENAFSNPKLCQGGAWSAPYFVGETGLHGELNSSNPFCETRWPSGDIITGITSYSNGNVIRGLQFQYSNGAIRNYGAGFNSQPSGSITLGQGEIFTSGWLAGDGVGTRLGKMHFETNKNQKIDFGYSNGRSVTLDVAGGVLIGATGYCNTDIDNLGLLFLQAQVSHVAISNYRFDNDPATNGPPLTAQTLDKVYFYNEDLQGTGSFTFTGNKVASNSNQWSQTTTGTFGTHADFELSAEVLGVGAKVSGGYQWSAAHSTETQTSTSESAGLTWSQSNSLGPGKTAECTAITQHGEGDFPYSSTVTLELTDGSSFTYQEHGTLKSVQYSQVEVTCRESDRPFA